MSTENKNNDVFLRVEEEQHGKINHFSEKSDKCTARGK